MSLRGRGMGTAVFVVVGGCGSGSAPVELPSPSMARRHRRRSSGQKCLGAPVAIQNRLRSRNTANGPARVVVSLGSCSAVDCNASPAPLPMPVSFTVSPSANGAEATVTLLQSSDSGGQPVVGYQIRYAALPNKGAIDAGGGTFGRRAVAEGVAP